MIGKPVQDAQFGIAPWAKPHKFTTKLSNETGCWRK